MMRYIFLILALFTVTGCATIVPPKTVQVEIIKFKFVPANITINKGDTVIWTNKEKRQYHSVWFEQMGAPEPDYMFPGDIFTQTFDEAGNFPYRCGPHPKMLGSVTVK